MERKLIIVDCLRIIVIVVRVLELVGLLRLTIKTLRIIRTIIKGIKIDWILKIIWIKLWA